MPKSKEPPVLDTNVYLNPKIFENLLKALVRGYQFYNQNKNPTGIIIEYPAEVSGIPVTWKLHGEGQDAKEG
jgi:ABC-type nitrate/sulfonate/bicarbonate transport system substrate-binding protein